MPGFDSAFPYLLAYLGTINLVTFAAFVADKAKAIRKSWRISESTLLGLAMLGGSLGGIIGMKVARHKTRKPKFKYGLPAILLIEAAGGMYLAYSFGLFQ